MTVSFFFYFNFTAATEFFTLSLHDALPISEFCERRVLPADAAADAPENSGGVPNPYDWRSSPHTVEKELEIDRKSTRLNSSHMSISYAVFCLKKKTPLAPWWACSNSSCPSH